MPPQGHPAARSHLRLASAPGSRERRDRKLFLVLRAALAAFLLAWTTAAAYVATVLALLPLVWRRAPLGRRLHPPRREARVIPFQPKRPQRQALPR